MLPPLARPDDLPAGLDQSAIATACGTVRAYCGWHVAPQAFEMVTVDGSGGTVQFLPTLHLTELRSITNDGVAVESPEWSTAGMVRGARWTSKWRGVVADITHGYDMCPDEILGVVASLASAGMAGMPQNMQAGPFGMNSSPYQQAGASALSPAQRAVLDRYKLPPRP